jgi:hypothetical protein
MGVATVETVVGDKVAVVDFSDMLSIFFFLHLSFFWDLILDGLVSQGTRKKLCLIECSTT